MSARSDWPSTPADRLSCARATLAIFADHLQAHGNDMGDALHALAKELESIATEIEKEAAQ